MQAIPVLLAILVGLLFGLLAWGFLGIDAKTMSLQYLEALKALGSGPATKFIFPIEFTQLLRPFVSYAGASLAEPEVEENAE